MVTIWNQFGDISFDLEMIWVGDSLIKNLVINHLIWWLINDIHFYSATLSNYFHEFWFAPKFDHHEACFWQV